MSYQTYLQHISAYEQEFAQWERRGDKIVCRYRTGRNSTLATTDDSPAKFNVLWSNVQTLKAATYARTPMPDVSRRFKDNDKDGRVAALLIERNLEFQVRHFRDYAATLGQCTYDRFLPGRGTAWVRYEPKFAPPEQQGEGEQITEDAETETPTGEEIEDENCPVDYVHWKDFGHQIARTWEECNIVWRKVYLSQLQADQRFPDAKLPMDSSPDDNLKKMPEPDSVNKQALVYEIWDKETGKAIWLSKSLGKVIDEKQDPLGLEEFFPCPPPLYSTLTTDSLVPTADFKLYEDQANELDTLAERIDGLIKALQIRGVHDASVPELARIMTEAGNTDLIPVKNWAAFAEKKGLAGAMELIDIAPIASALLDAYKAFDQVKGQIYELTGISDILRGETAPSETATAQQIKNSYASLRLKVYQDEVERFATRLLQLKAEIICNHFDPQSIADMACWEQMTPEDQQSVWVFGPPQLGPDGQPMPPKPIVGPDGRMVPGPAMRMLKSGVTRSFRIEVETDSMAFQDEQQEKQNRMEFLQACGQFLESTVKISQEVPSLAPLAVEMMKYGVTGFRVGKNLEGTIDQAVEMMKKQAQQAASQPKPNPDAIKAQAAGQAVQIKAQSDQAMTQAEEQGETQRTQMKLQADAQQDARDKAHEAQMAALQARNDHASEKMRETFEAQIEQMKQNAAAQAAQTNAALQMILRKMQDATTLEVAEIGAQTTLDAAQVSAAKAAEQ